MKNIWTYNHSNATLLKNGKPFAFVTPDGKDALSENDANELLADLNSAVDPMEYVGRQVVHGGVVLVNRQRFVNVGGQNWCLPPETPESVVPGDSVLVSIADPDDQFCRFEKKL